MSRGLLTTERVAAVSFVAAHSGSGLEGHFSVAGGCGWLPSCEKRTMPEHGAEVSLATGQKLTCAWLMNAGCRQLPWPACQLTVTVD